MGRRRKAWLVGGSGRRMRNGRRLPGYYVDWHEAGRHFSRCFSSQALAREFCSGLNNRIDRARALGLVAVTVREASDEFLSGLDLLSKSTRVDVAAILGRFVAGYGEDRHLCEAAPGDVDDYLSARMSVTPETRGRKCRAAVTESTLAKEFRYLVRFFRWCAARKYIGSIPTEQATVRPRPRPREMGPLPTDKQIATLLASIDVEAMRVAAALALTTGLDRGVIWNLTPERINLDERTIVTMRQKTARSRPTTLVVPIHASIVPSLVGLLNRTSPESRVFEGYYDDDWYDRARAKAGPPWDKLRIVDFRKIASGLLQRVMPATQVQRLLGHSSIVVTASHYSPPDPSVRRAFDTVRLDLPARKRKAT